MSTHNGPNGGALARPRPPAQVAPGGVTDALVVNAETARALAPGAATRDIVKAFTRFPFKVGASVVLDPSRPMSRDERGELVIAEGGGGALSEAAARELASKGAAVKGIAVVNRVTPEQLLAVVVSLVATSRNAAEACVRIRQEVKGWEFENQAGERY